MEFKNAIRDVSGIFTTMVAAAPRFISLFKATDPATSTTHGWINDLLGNITLTVTAASGNTLTVSAADAAKIDVGSVLRLTTAPALFVVTNISGTSVTVSLLAANGSDVTEVPAESKLLLMYDPKEKGSCEGLVNLHQGDLAENYTQIFRRDAELTGTDASTRTYDQANQMDKQVLAAMDAVMRDMNNAAIFGFPQKVNGKVTPGMAGGIFHFGSQTGGIAVNADGAALDNMLVNDAAVEIANAGGNANIILCSTGQARVLSADMKEKVVVMNRDETRGSYVAQVINDVTGRAQTVFAETAMPDDVAFVIDDTGLGLTPLQNRQLTESDATDPSCDSEKRKIIGEYTFEFRNAKQRIGKIYGLKDSKTVLAGLRTK